MTFKRDPLNPIQLFQWGRHRDRQTLSTSSSAEVSSQSWKANVQHDVPHDKVNVPHDTVNMRYDVLHDIVKELHDVPHDTVNVRMMCRMIQWMCAWCAAWYSECAHDNSAMEIVSSTTSHFVSGILYIYIYIYVQERPSDIYIYIYITKTIKLWII